MLLIVLYKVMYENLISNTIKAWRRIIRRRFNEEESQFYKCIEQHNYVKASELGSDLIYRSHDYEMIRKTAICSYFAGKENEAFNYMKMYLDVKGIKVNEILEFIRKEFPFGDIESLEYKVNGGFSNYGFIEIKRSQHPDYIIKILPETKKGLRESIFYNEILPTCIALQKYIPEVCFSTNTHGCYLIGTQLIQNENPGEPFDERYLELFRVIQSVPLAQITRMISKTLVYKGNGEMGRLNNRLTNQYIFERMRSNVSKANGAHVLISIIDELEEYVIGKKAYKAILPEYHYCFCHNDFHRNNLLNYNNNVYVLDWSNYTIALRGWDLAYYLGNFEVEFLQIEPHINNSIYEKSDKVSCVGKAFFAYAQIYIWTARLRGSYKQVYEDKYFRPALVYAKKMFKQGGII